MDAPTAGHEAFLQRKALAALAKKLPAKAVVKVALVGQEDGREGLLVATKEHIAWARRRWLGHDAVIVAIKAAKLDRERAVLTVRGGRRAFSVRAHAKRLQRFVAAVTDLREGRTFEEEHDSARTIERLLAKGSMSKAEAEWAWRAGR